MSSGRPSLLAIGVLLVLGAGCSEGGHAPDASEKPDGPGTDAPREVTGGVDATDAPAPLDQAPDGPAGETTPGDGPATEGTPADVMTVDAPTPCELLPQGGCSSGKACYVEPNGVPFCGTAGTGDVADPCTMQTRCLPAFYCEPVRKSCCPFCPTSEVGTLGSCPAFHICCPRKDLPMGTSLCYPVSSLAACPDR